MKNKNRFLGALAAFLCVLSAPVFAGAGKEKPADSPEPVTLMVAAAASLENAFTGELIPRFRAKYPWISIEGVYDSSGRLQVQIEQGLQADVFMSAAERQMDALAGKGLVAKDTVRPLLQNKLVLIKPAGTVTAVTGFQNIALAAIIALGDPASVPAGQYAKEALVNLGVWDAVQGKLSLGNNVTEVLAWVAEGSAEAGVVYATDAASTKKVTIIEELPDGLLSGKVIYPAGMIASSAHPEEAALFIDFLESEEGLAVFRGYGFSAH
ncbi:MAG: molybdate ABC transporter substrate-binding protein [Treponema sp.]|jgi:molybdate transport system substrate-binding protein|nr:molybdate ABC transporter substrate-binding protein [Treponema sp.]